MKRRFWWDWQRSAAATSRGTRSTRGKRVQAFGAATLVSELNTTEGYYITSVTADDCIAYMAGPNGANASDMFVATKPL